VRLKTEEFAQEHRKKNKDAWGDVCPWCYVLRWGTAQKKSASSLLFIKIKTTQPISHIILP